MELTGVEIDTDYAQRLSKVYHEKSDEVQEKIFEMSAEEAKKYLLDLIEKDPLFGIRILQNS